jgi:serine/threonine protein phosphatase 1
MKGASQAFFPANLRLHPCASITVGKYFLCHAGVRPGVPLERQSIEDRLWIRDEFLSSTADFG